MQSPRILVFDSGLGGLTVYREIARTIPQAAFFYAADDAGFPYGAWAADDLVWRVVAVMRRLIAETEPDVVVIACNTASTLVLPHLRAAFAHIPFVGTVPAIKPAAERSRSRMISVLATPGTVTRDYTRDLVSAFAAHCSVQLVGSHALARIAEDFMHGVPVSDAQIHAEIAPCFVTAEQGRTDEIVLACTHYPLLLEHFTRLAPWPVDWIDPAPAIARRVEHVLGEKHSSLRGALTKSAVADLATERRSNPASDQGSGLLRYQAKSPTGDFCRARNDGLPGRAIFTSGATPTVALAQALRDFGLRAIEFAPMPVDRQAAL